MHHLELCRGIRGVRARQRDALDMLDVVREMELHMADPVGEVVGVHREDGAAEEELAGFVADGLVAGCEGPEASGLRRRVQFVRAAVFLLAHARPLWVCAQKRRLGIRLPAGCPGVFHGADRLLDTGIVDMYWAAVAGLLVHVDEG